MGWQPTPAFIYDCDTCETKSALQAPGELPSGWKLEEDQVICKHCIDKRPCEHYSQKIDCDICQGKRCPDCLLQLDQEWHHYDSRDRKGPRKLIGVYGHLPECQWVRKTYPQCYSELGGNEPRC